MREATRPTESCLQPVGATQVAMLATIFPQSRSLPETPEQTWPPAAKCSRHFKMRIPSPTCRACRITFPVRRALG